MEVPQNEITFKGNEKLIKCITIKVFFNTRMVFLFIRCPIIHEGWRPFLPKLGSCKAYLALFFWYFELKLSNIVSKSNLSSETRIAFKAYLAPEIIIFIYTHFLLKQNQVLLTIFDIWNFSLLCTGHLFYQVYWSCNIISEDLLLRVNC